MPAQIETQSQIERYLRIICNAFLKEGGWRYANALYLIGGFARDEGSVDIYEEDLRIYNDLDLLVVIKHKNPWTLLSLQRILSRLNDGRFQFYIDLVFLSEKELSYPEPSILNFDIQRNHRHLWGSDPLRKKSNSFLEAKDFPLTDTLQLLLNRQASLLIGLSLIQKDDPNKAYIQVQLSKPLSAMLATLQILEGSYTSSETGRVQWMRNQIEKKSDPIWKIFQDPALQNLLSEYEKFKDKPQPEHFMPFKENSEFLVKIYSDFLYIFMAKLYGLPSEISREKLIEHFCSKQIRQWDLFSFSWWVSKYRAHPDRIKFRFNCHPHLHVQVYASHLLWMNKLSKWREFISWYNGSSDQNDLELMINAWKVSGYKCHLQ